MALMGKECTETDQLVRSLPMESADLEMNVDSPTFYLMEQMLEQCKLNKGRCTLLLLRLRLVLVK